MSKSHVSAQEFKEKLASTPEAVLLDVRTPAEYRAGHILGAQNLNMASSITG